jgi:hypothetical protein
VEIPLVLTAPAPDRLSYGLPLWFRLVMGAILALVILALATSESAPGALAWIVLTILVLGTLYEDRWEFDGALGRATHRAGLLIAARSRVVAFEEIQRLRIVPLVKGTLPGTAEERAENQAALQGARADDASLKRDRYKKPFLSLEIECLDGTRYLMDHMSARRAVALRAVASRIAEFCGKPLSDEPGG